MTLSYLSQKELCKVNIPHIFTFCCCCYWVAMSTLGNSMDCSIPGSSVLHYVLEFAQIRVHWVNLFHFSSVQLLNCVQFFATPWTAACEASLFITNSRSLLKLMSIESVMTSNHLILCHSLLLLPSIFPIIRVFSNDSALRIRRPKYWIFSFNISPTNEHSGLISFRMDWLDLLAVHILCSLIYQRSDLFWSHIGRR